MAAILVIEDEPGIAQNLCYALETEGLSVKLAGSIAAGWQAFRESLPELVIMDVGLPDGSGFDLCRRIRQQSLVPLLFLTARESEVDRIVGLELGGDDYVIKPFSPREVSARVRALLRRQPGGAYAPGVTESDDDESAAAVPSWGALRHDCKRQRLLFYDQALALSVQQYRLLLTLLRQPGRVFSRRELLQAAWSEPDMSELRTVDSHIRDIRCKLRAIAEDAVIRTHRGMGYSLDDESA